METKKIKTRRKSPTNSDILNAMIQHFKDDAVAFRNIDEKFNKYNEIATTNGEHMSYIAKDLNTYNTKIDNLTEIVTKHITAVEPILSTYNDTQVIKRVFVKITAPVVAFILTLGSLIGAYYAIVGFILK